MLNSSFQCFLKVIKRCYIHTWKNKHFIVYFKWLRSLFRIFLLCFVKTGTGIIIRGKGSVKEGKVGHKDGRPLPAQDEPLHAYVTANNPENVKKAVERVRVHFCSGRHVMPLFHAMLGQDCCATSYFSAGLARFKSNDLNHCFKSRFKSTINIMI